MAGIVEWPESVDLNAPNGATSRRRPPWGAFLMPRPLAVDPHSLRIGSRFTANARKARSNRDVDGGASSAAFWKLHSTHREGSPKPGTAPNAQH